MTGGDPVISRLFRLAGRHGRFLLVLGLVAGLALPGLAQVLRPFLPHLVAALLFLTALRIGPKEALGGLGDLRHSLGLIAVLQLALPLLALGLFSALGIAGAPLCVALVLMLAAPSVTGSPNFTILLGHDPAPAMRLLILGTALFPLTVLPVLWLAPGLGNTAAVMTAAARLTVLIAASVAAGFVLRHFLFPELSAERREALDGVTAMLLAVVVIGLMSALGPALRHDPARLALTLAAAFAVNFGMQGLAALALGRGRPATAATSIVAGNRNIALFLLALPAASTDPLLIFIGCYQIPMYLTPILMRRFYGHPA